MKTVIAAILLTGASCGPALAQAAPAAPTIPAKPPFSPSVQVGDLLFLSGQIGQVPKGMDPHKEGFDAAVKAAMESSGRILAADKLDFGHVVKCTVMLADMADWPRFNAVYLPYFAGKRLPARSAFGANGLAMGAPLEVECIAAFK